MDYREKTKSSKESREEKVSPEEEEKKKKKAEKPEILNVGITPGTEEEGKINPGTEADAATG